MDVLIQELSAKLTKDRCCLLSYSLGGDRFPIATVWHLCKARCNKASCYCSGQGLKFRPHTSHTHNTRPAVKRGAVSRRVNRCDGQLKGEHSPNISTPSMVVFD